MTAPYLVSRGLTHEPFVTIAIPTFNRASWLKDCLVAALSQTYQHFEVLVSDNASTDETPDVLRQFGDPRLRIVRQKSNIGLLPNWNACLAEARGEYIVYCSDDDRLSPRMVEWCVAVAARDSQVPIVLGLYDSSWPAEGRVLHASPSDKFTTGIWKGTRLLVEYLRNKRFATHICSMMIRSSILRAGGGLPLDFPTNCADIAAWTPLLMKGDVGFVNDTCATYCAHSASETSTFTLEQLLDGQRQLADYIVAMADSAVEDDSERCRVRLAAKFFLADRIVFNLAQYCKAGHRLVDVIPWVWRWRREIIYVGLVNPLNFAKPIALILFPKSMADRVRQLKRIYRQMFDSEQVI